MINSYVSRDFSTVLWIFILSMIKLINPQIDQTIYNQSLYGNVSPISINIYVTMNNNNTPYKLYRVEPLKTVIDL